MLYAGLDGSKIIEVKHIEAAEALWAYSQDTVEYLYKNSSGVPIADRLLEALTKAGAEGLSFTEQTDLFQRHCPKEKLEEARQYLTQKGLVITKKISNAGRPASRTFVTPPCDKSERSEKRGDALPLISNPSAEAEAKANDSAQLEKKPPGTETVCGSCKQPADRFITHYSTGEPICPDCVAAFSRTGTLDTYKDDRVPEDGEVF